MLCTSKDRHVTHFMMLSCVAVGVCYARPNIAKCCRLLKIVMCYNDRHVAHLTMLSCVTLDVCNTHLNM